MKEQAISAAGLRRALNLLAFLVSALMLATASVMPAKSDAVSDFYTGKTVFLQIGSGAGGTYDTIGRLVARYIGAYIPGNPKVVAQNVPSGGSLLLANQFANITPRDGTYFGVFNDGMPTTPLLSPGAAHFDPRKFNFLGSPIRQAQVLLVTGNAPIKTLDDALSKELIVGATGGGAASFDFPVLTNALLGTKMKIVTGYQSGPMLRLAIERGEIQAIAGVALFSVKTEYASAVKSGEMKVIAAYGLSKHPELPNVPLFPLGQTPEAHQIFTLLYARQAYGTSFIMPPEVPADRIMAMQKALEATFRDINFVADARKLTIDIDAVSANELKQLTEEIYQTSPTVIQKMQALLEVHSK